MTLAPGLYKWSSNVTIPTSVTLSGGADDVWVFQIGGNLNIASAGSVASGIKVLLAGGAKASNVFWQVGGVTGATLGTYSTFNGTILSAKQIIMQTGAVLNGRPWHRLKSRSMPTPLRPLAHHLQSRRKRPSSLRHQHSRLILLRKNPPPPALMSTRAWRR